MEASRYDTISISSIQIEALAKLDEVRTTYFLLNT